MIGVILITVGVAILFVGYFFLAKSDGQKDCKEKPESTNANFGGGIAGVVLGVVTIIVGFILHRGQ